MVDSCYRGRDISPYINFTTFFLNACSDLTNFLLDRHLSLQVKKSKVKGKERWSLNWKVCRRWAVVCISPAICAIFDVSKMYQKSLMSSKPVGERFTLVLLRPLKQPIKRLLLAMDQFAHIIISFIFIFTFFRFFLSQMTTLKQYHWVRYRETVQVIFLIPKRLVYDSKLLTVTETQFLLTFWRDYQRTSDENNEKHQLRDVVLINLQILSTNFEDIYGNQ